MFVTKNVTKDEKYYYIKVVTMYENTEDGKFGFIQKVAKRGEEHTFILEEDGDYLTIYLNDLDNILVELIAVDDWFIHSVYQVALEKEIYPDQINWPKRASEK